MKHALILAAAALIIGLASPVSAAPLTPPQVAMPTCTAPWTCTTQQGGAVIVQHARKDTIVWGAPAGWHYIIDAATKQVFLFPVLDDTTSFANGFLRNQDAALVVAFDASSTVGISATITSVTGNVQVVDSISKSALLSTAASCTLVATGVHTLAKMVNVSSTADGASQEIKIYDDTVCTNAANLVYDIVQAGAGQIFTLDIPMTTGISVSISNNGALSGSGIRVTYI